MHIAIKAIKKIRTHGVVVYQSPLTLKKMSEKLLYSSESTACRLLENSELLTTKTAIDMSKIPKGH